MIPLPRCGLYAITDSKLLPPEHFLAAVKQAISGGAVMIQYRDKGSSAARRREQAGALVTLCRENAVPLVINDDVPLALEVGADGVHLGRDDIPPAAAREALGANAIIGVSCYNEPERALRAEANGASYVAFGRFYQSFTKPRAVKASLEMLRWVTPQLSVPVAVIGGITAENGASLVEAGADLLAVIGGVFGLPQPRVAAARFSRLFRTRTPGPTERCDARNPYPDAQ